jgi:hypothetical protein
MTPRGRSSVGRASASQAEGREFEPRRPLRESPGDRGFLYAALGLPTRSCSRRPGLYRAAFRLARRPQESDQFADRVMPVIGVAKRKLAMHLVLIPTTVAAPTIPCQVPSRFEVVHDLSNCPLRDTHACGNVPKPRTRVSCDALKNMSVVCDEPPRIVSTSGT